MSLFDINYTIIPTQMLPIRERKPMHKAWIRALIAGTVGVLNLIFRANRFGNLYKLEHTGQVFSLENVLNDAFDSVGRRIYITDADYVNPVYIYTDAELSPVFLALESEVGSTSYTAPSALYRESEILAANNGFIIWVPASLVYDAARFAKIVNEYRLPSKASWIIKTF